MNIGSLFGKKAAPKNNNETKEKVMQAITDLNARIEDMDEKIKHIEVKKNTLNEQAKTKLKAGDKNGARQALAKKKKLDEQIKQFDGALMMMEEQKMMLENAESTKMIFETLKNANSVLTEANKGMNIEDLERLREQMDDMKDVQNEMQEFFKSAATTEDEDVENELEELQAQLEGDKASFDLPEAKKGKFSLLINRKTKTRSQS
jgi:charged multivesicular body protein 4